MTLNPPKTIEQIIKSLWDRSRSAPTDIHGRKKLASLLLNQGDYDRALLVYEELNHLDPEDGSHSLGLGLLLAQSGHWKRATLILANHVTRFPQEDKGYLSLQEVHARLGQTAERQKVLTTALRYCPKNPRFPRLLASLFEEQGHFVDASDCLKTSLRLDPSQKEVALKLGGLLIKIGRPRDALPLFQGLHLETPGTFAHLYNLANLQQQLGNFTAAIPLWSNALKIAPNEERRRDLQFHLATCYLESGAIDRATITLEGILETDGRPEVLCALADCHKRAGEFQEEVYYRLRLLPQIKDGESLPQHLAYVEALQRVGNLKGALHHIEKLVDTFPGTYEIHFTGGELAERLGKGELALRFFARASLLRPDAIEPRVRLARGLGLKGDVAGQKEQTDAVLRFDPTHPEGLYTLGLQELKGGDRNRARALFLKLLALPVKNQFTALAQYHLLHFNEFAA